jgi:drug/metabolite transporter (DMT)-like permease
LPDFLKLHFVILLWGFTAVLGKLIEVSSTQLVLLRSACAAAILMVVLRRRAAVPCRLALALVANGMLLGLHWILFFLAVKIANVSICMVGMATVSFWTAILEPLMIRSVRFQKVNLWLGVIVTFAVYLIYRSETKFHSGLLIAITAAVIACLFSIINGRFTGQAKERVIVMYEMAGAALVCAIALVVGQPFGIQLVSDRWLFVADEWLWFGILVLLCTLLAYEIYVELLHRLSVFTINFANNMEPVYGITFGALFFADHQAVAGDFYLGAAIILAAVLFQPFIAK